MATGNIDSVVRGPGIGRARATALSAAAQRFGLSLSIALVALLALSFAVASQRGEGLEVPEPEGLSLVACPFDFEARPQPNRVVLQVIELRFHKWEEHDLSPDAFCIVMLEPDRRVLDLAEAWALLEESSRWIEQEPDPAWEVVIDADEIEDIPPAVPPHGEDLEETPRLEPDLPAPPAFPRRPDDDTDSVVRPFGSDSTTPDVVIGDDDRVRVANTTTLPWWVTGYQFQQYPNGQSFRCTAFLVAPHTALTNGHCVYSESSGGYATSVSFAPAQYQSVEGGTITRPYGLHSSVQWQTNAAYINDQSFDTDYAGTHFNQSFADLGVTTYIPLAFDFEPSGIINTAGYPGTVQGWSNNQAMWHSAGDVVGVLNRTLRYVADTSGGQSGSAVWRFVAPDTRQVVAIHAFGNASGGYNGGPRLVWQNQGVIEGWMTWAPDGVPGNDDFADAFVISGSNGSTSGTNVGATKEPGEPNHGGYSGGASVWWWWTAPHYCEATIDTTGSDFDVLLGVYTGTSVSSLTEVAGDGSPGTDNSVTFMAEGGTTYRIAVDGWGGFTGSIQLNWDCEVAPPGNDDFADAFVISGSSGSTSGTNVGATKEPGEPNHAGVIGGASVWWRWTAPSSGDATIDTFGSDFDTVLAVYTGTSVSNLPTEIASNDDAGGTLQSLVTFPAIAGTTYRIAVDGWGAATGSIQLNWELEDAPPPPGDAGIRPVASDCGGTVVGEECSVWVDLVDNEIELGGLEFELLTPRFTPIAAQAVGIAGHCIASVGPTGTVGVICAQPLSGSGGVARIDLTRDQSGDSVFVTSNVALIDLDGNAIPGWGDELVVSEFVCEIAYFVDNPFGDFNDDGVVSTPDALLILRTAVGALPPPPPGSFQSYHGDLNSGGTITTADALLALQKAVDPTRPARLAVAPRALTLAQGQSACVLIGNAGSQALPPVTIDAPGGLSVSDITHSGAIGRVYKITRDGASLGTITFSAGAAGSLTVTVEP